MGRSINLKLNESSFAQKFICSDLLKFSRALSRLPSLSGISVEKMLDFFVCVPYVNNLLNILAHYIPLPPPPPN